jgi:hypothetical protein
MLGACSPDLLFSGQTLAALELVEDVGRAGKPALESLAVLPTDIGNTTDGWPVA